MENKSYGSYRGVEINPGDDASVQQQIQSIDASQNQASAKQSAPVTPTSNATINSNNMAPTTPITPVAAPTPTMAAGLQGSIEEQARSYTDSVVKADEVAMAEKNKTTSFNSLIEKARGTSGKTALTDKAYTDTVDPAKKELDQINADIRAEQASLRRQVERIEKAGGGLVSGQNVEIDRLTRESIAKQADLSIIQMAKQNNYATAKEIADRKVSAQLEADKQELEVLQLTYNEYKDLFTKQEQRQFETNQAERNRLLKKEETELKAVNDIALDAQQNGAPTDLVKQALRAKTQEEAIGLVGSYVGKLDRDKARAQMYTESLQQQKLLKELNPSSDGAANADLMAYANQYSDTGTLPSPSELKQSGLTVGQVTEYAKQAPKPDGSLVSTSTGVKSKSISSTQEDGIIALKDVNDKLGELRVLYGQSGPGNAKMYNVLKQEIVDAISRARSGAALTADEEKRYNDMLPSIRLSVRYFGNKELSGLQNSIQSKLNTTLQTTGTSIYGYSKANVNGVERIVGEILDIGGVPYKVLPDGTLTDII